MTPEPIATSARQNGFTVAQVWLDSLSRGNCDEESFLRAMQAITQRSPEEGWDCLSLLDQYYRRGKISNEAFSRLKTQLGNQLMKPSSHAGTPEPPAAPSAAPTVARPPTPSPDAPAVASAIAAASAPQSVPVLSSAIPISSGRLPREINVGDVIRGRYVIRSVIGRGVTGPIFEAIDRYRLDLQETGQRVALILLDLQRPELVMELRREFQLMQSLSHPNIVRAYGYDRDGDTEFFATEYLSGLPLASVLSAREQMPLDRPEALAILRDVGSALAHAHSRGVVHGDLNPGKVFITNDGEVRVQNFGAPRASYNGTADAASLIGPLYASCQVLNGESADARDDVYSCACLVYVLLSGRPPFGELTAVQARAQELKPARPKAATAREWHALKSALSFDRDLRPSDMTDWLKQFSLSEATPRLPALLALTRSRPARPRRSLAPILGTFILALLVAGWWAMGHPGLRDREIDSLSAGAQSAMQSAGNWVRGLGHKPGGAPEPSTPSSPVPSNVSSVPAPSAATPPTAPPAAMARVPTAPASRAAPAPRAPPAVVHAVPAATPAAPHAASLRSHIELAADTVDVRLGDPAARILVRRSGNLHGDLTFSWWTESGTAKPGQDYATVKPHAETIEDGKSFVNLYVPVVADSTRREPKSFYVVIRDPPDGTTLGRNLIMVTIPSSAE